MSISTDLNLRSADQKPHLVHTQGHGYELPARHLFTLGASIKHTVESLDDSAFLLTMAWPNDEELRALLQRVDGS
jgi:hypothetical protein